MRWCLSTPGYPEYILPVALSTSVTPVSPYTRHRWWMMHLEAVFEWVQRCTWRPELSELRDALGGQDQVNSEMHLEARFKWTQRWTWRPRLSELRAAQGGRDWVHLEMHLQAIIERDWRSTWKRSIWRQAGRQLRLNSLVNLYIVRM